MQDGSTTHSSTPSHHRHTPLPPAAKKTSAACSSRTSPPSRPPPPLPAALLDVSTVRTAYQQALDEHDTLAGAVATFNGPTLSAAMPQIRELRATPEADRPYWLAVQEVIDQWADADVQYDANLAQIDWAQAQLDDLLAAPDPTHSTSPLPKQTCACDA